MQVAPLCEDCPYFGRVKVMGEGLWESPVALVGQSPGKIEMEQGSPFVGPAGERLGAVLAEIRVARPSIWITNTVKCYLPAKTTVNKTAIKCCSVVLREELRGRKLVIAVGTVARDACMSAIAGRSTAFFHIIHPAAALRNAMDEARLRRDTKLLSSFLDKLEEGGLCVRTSEVEDVTG